MLVSVGPAVPVLSLGVGEMLGLLSTLHATGTASSSERLRAVGGFGGFFSRELWRTYVARQPL